MTEWIFAELTGASIRRDPQETELFKTEGAGEGEYAGTDALVREVIQTPMDAGTGDGPVRVRFAIHGASDLPCSSVLSNYFSRLEPALAYREVDLEAMSPKTRSWLSGSAKTLVRVVLGGNVRLANDPPPNNSTREDFFWSGET